MRSLLSSFLLNFDAKYFIDKKSKVGYNIDIVQMCLNQECVSASSLVPTSCADNCHNNGASIHLCRGKRLMLTAII